MKISPGMVEAGATRWASVKHLSPESIVAAVYEAMDKRREYEDGLRRNPNAEKPVYQHQEWPSWRYGPKGEARKFDKAEDVPVGWTDRPQEPARKKAA